MQWQSFLQAVHKRLRSSKNPEKIYAKRTESSIISLISNNPEIVDLISSWLISQCKVKTSKCPKTSKDFREKGNNLFKNNDYKKSVEMYTKSAKFSSIEADDYSLAIANRSAALFHMCRYEDCLNDIEVAIESGYPEKLRHKVHLRAAQCHIKLRNSESAEKEIKEARAIINSDKSISASVKDNLMKQVSALFLELQKLPKDDESSHKKLNPITPELLIGKNENYPSASPALQRESSPTRGRFVVAKESIKKGDVLFVEKPFAFVPLDHEDSILICGNCCGEQSDVNYPCRGCIDVFYCSPNCWRKSWINYHCWECPGYSMGIWRQIGIAHLAVKVLLVSVETDDIEKFNDVQKLITNIEKLSEDDLMIYSITALMLSQYLDEHTDFLKSIDLKKSIIDKFRASDNIINLDITSISSKKKFLSSLLLRHMLQLISNGHAITRLNLMNKKCSNIVDEQQERVAVGIYPSVSMMNHSCDPTIMNTFWNDYLIVKSTKNIEAGDEIFNCYGPHFRRMSLDERQRSLKNQYCFECKCPPCTDPNLQNFLDRFTAFKCPLCSGPSSLNNEFKCLDCHEIMKIDAVKMSKDLEIAQNLFKSAENYFEIGKFEDSRKKLTKCLDIRKNLLYKYHEDIAITLDTLGKVSVIMGQSLNSINYLEESLIIVEEKFGKDSIEVANELNKITDVCIQYLQKEMKRRSDIYRNTLIKTQNFLQRAEDIMRLLSGPWNSACRELIEKKEELTGMFESLHV